MHILLVEDDPLVASGIVTGLQLHGLTIDHVDTAKWADAALARLDAESTEVEISDPVEAVDAAIKALSPLHGDLHGEVAGRVHVLGADAALPVHAARPLLVAAVQNLIDNALRYAPEGTPVIARIEPQNHGMMRISVLDEGPGMDEEARSQAVNRFWRGDPTKPGYGLGLSIVNAIARRYGGSLELLQRNDGGLEARLTLPMQDGSTQTCSRRFP